MEWADSKECFGNTPENEIRPDLSKLNPGGSRFQAMVLTHHFDGYAVISEAGVASMFGLFRVEVWRCHATVGDAVISKQRLQPSWTNNPPKSGPARFAGRRLRSNPKKPGDIKTELAPI